MNIHVLSLTEKLTFFNRKINSNKLYAILLFSYLKKVSQTGYHIKKKKFSDSNVTNLIEFGPLNQNGRIKTKKPFFFAKILIFPNWRAQILLI